MKELPHVYKRIFLTFSCFESWPEITTLFLISAMPRNSDAEESSEEESDAVSIASKSVKSKTGRRSQWTVDQIDDFIDIVINNENFKEKLIFQNTKFQRNSSIYQQIQKKLKARCAERNEEFNFSVNQLRSKFKKLVGECKKVALTVKTASGIENFIRDRGYGTTFNNLYSLVKTRDSCNPDKAVEPSASLTAKGSGDESEVLDVNTDSSTSGEKEQKKFVPVRKNRKRKQTDDNCTLTEAFQLMRGMLENDPTRDLIAMMREDMERSRQHELRLMQVFMGTSSASLGSPYAATMYPGYFPGEFPSLQGCQFHPVAPSTVSQSSATQSQARGSSPSTDSFVSEGSVYLPL